MKYERPSSIITHDRHTYMTWIRMCCELSHIINFPRLHELRNMQIEESIADEKLKMIDTSDCNLFPYM